MPDSLLKIATTKLGPVKGARVVVFVGCWALAMRKCGERWDLMTETQKVEAYCDAYVCSRATGWRHLGLYRSVFDVDPTVMVRRLELDVVNRRQAKDVWAIGMRPT